MGWCSAMGCSNNPRDGFSLKRFPSDPEMRKAWAVKVNRENWTPTNNSRLCEAHFTPEMFELKRADGKLKLRWNAIPTIFSDIPHNKCMEFSTKSVSQENKKCEYEEDQSVIADDMVGCCAVSCTNSRANGFLMEHFPSDPEWRKLWTAKVKRENWTPTNTSVLCEAHFTSNMFEQSQADGRRILKSNAIPTIFSHIPQHKRWKPQTKWSSQEKKKSESKYQSASADDMYSVAHLCSVDVKEDIPTSSCTSLLQELQDLENRLESYSNAYNKELFRNHSLKTELKKAKQSFKELDDNIYLKYLKDFFNSNQIEILKNDKVKSKTNWDNDTLKKALKIRLSCGNNGYKELISQNIPLPSPLTLRRKMQQTSFQLAILDDKEFIDFLQLVKTKRTLPANLNPLLDQIKDQAIIEHNLNNAELNALYCISGYLISNIKKKCKCCDACLVSLGGQTPHGLQYEKLTILRRFNDNSVFFCNENTFNFFLQLEAIFETYFNQIKSIKGGIKELLVTKMSSVSVNAAHILDCHKIKDTIVKSFIDFRIKINSIKKNNFPQRSTYSMKCVNICIQKYL